MAARVKEQTLIAAASLRMRVHKHGVFAMATQVAHFEGAL